MKPDDLTPILTSKGVRVIIHILPVNSVDPSTSIDISKLAERDWENVASLAFGIPRNRDCFFNYDGFCIEQFQQSLSDGQYERTRYVQVFRNGSVESGIGLERASYIGNDFEANRIRQIRDLLNLLYHLEVEPPIFIMLTLLDAKGCSVIPPPTANYRGQFRDIDRNVVALPEVVLDDFGMPVEDVLRPAFNALYQAAGLPRSFSYDENGRWVGAEI